MVSPVNGCIKDAPFAILRYAAELISGGFVLLFASVFNLFVC